MPSVHYRKVYDEITGIHLAYGNGCRHHDDCFTCPYPPDGCKYDYSRGMSRKRIQKLFGEASCGKYTHAKTAG